MFKNFASDALGLSDIGKIIPPSQFNQTDVDDYIFHEDNERIYFVIKSKMDEYCFTNTAFIHLDGQSATSKKRTLKRYPYRYFAPSQVSIETAGTMDLDVELKFHLGGLAFSIDIDKSQIEGVRDIYKALTAIAERCQAIRHDEMVLEKTFETVAGMFNLKDVPEAVIMSLPTVINQTVQKVEVGYNERLNAIRQYDFGAVFEHYLRD
ncbi:PH domain-containing protein [Moraxella bovis]|uniref:PH domain-containing protein n=1 Tax=Moraxella bovis TaxID=476 RepID=UPI0022260BD8|nr:PH domain-containing protein [Moraxella bovis]UZA43158.1 PH domain-containing protein [Moraxella bovis]